MENNKFDSNNEFNISNDKEKVNKNNEEEILNSHNNFFSSSNSNSNTKSPIYVDNNSYYTNDEFINREPSNTQYNNNTNKGKIIKDEKNDKIIEFEKINLVQLQKPLNARITEHSKVTEDNIWSNKYYIYTVECENYNSKVYRRYNDFLWLRETLLKYYPGILIPPIPSKDAMGDLFDDEFFSKRKAQFNHFFKHLAQQKLLSSSLIIKDFLTEREFNEFNRKKSNYTNFSPDLSEFIEKIKCKFFIISK